MKLAEEEFAKIRNMLPVQRGNVSMTNLQLLNAILYVAEQGCKWRGIPENLGKWGTVYKRANRWAKSGVLDRVFAALQNEQIIKLKIEHVSFDSTNIKVHPDAHGALKKAVGKASGKAAAGGTQSFLGYPRLIRLRQGFHFQAEMPATDRKAESYWKQSGTRRRRGIC